MTQQNKSKIETLEPTQEKWVTPQATVLSTQETLANSGSGTYDGAGYDNGDAS